MDNIYKAVQLTIDSPNLALSKKPTHVYIANQYVDTNDTPLITAPFIIQKALENGTGVVDIVSSTIGSIYEVRLLCDAEVLISGYFYMPPMNAKFSELELYTSYPPRTPPVINEFWQKTENFILEKTNTLLNFVQVFNSLSSMRLSLGYLEELATDKKSNLVSAINEVFNKYKDVGALYAKNVAAGAGANGWDANLVAYGETTQKQINDGLDSVAAMLAIKNPSNGMRVYVKSYHAGLNKGGGAFVYDNSKASINDLGTVINGWVRQNIKTVTVWDFGYKSDDEVKSRAALIACFTSKYPTELLAETLDKHGGLIEVVIDGFDKVIYGKGSKSSILSHVKIVAKNGSFYFKGFKNNDNGKNYGVLITNYNDVFISDYECEICYDAVLLWYANSTESRALVENCIARKAYRIGFTVDIDGRNVRFVNCKTYDSRQGFHFEGCYNIKAINCETERCGSNAMPAIPDQPAEYAGGFRLFKFENVELINCKNGAYNGTGGDQIGSAGTLSKGLKLTGCNNINFGAEDVPADVYKDVSFIDCKNCGMVLWSFKANIAGRLFLKDCYDCTFELIGSGNAKKITYAEINNYDGKRLHISNVDSNAVLVMDKVKIRSSYFCTFTGFKHYILGDLVYDWDNSIVDHYPNLGFRFISPNMASFSLNTFRSIGSLGGYHISIEGANAANVKTATINTLVDENNGYNFYNPNNVDVRVLSRKGAAVANATATDDTANKLNALLTSLRNTKVIAP